MAVGVAYWQMPGEWRLVPCRFWLGLLRLIIVMGVLTHVGVDDLIMIESKWCRDSGVWLALLTWFPSKRAYVRLLPSMAKVLRA
jgi:hypothetical protein